MLGDWDSMLYSCLHKLYGLSGKSRWRRLILRLIKRLEGGEVNSVTLRRIFRDYHNVDIGMYSYGCFSPHDTPCGTVIGRYCSFAAGVVIFNANHPIDRISQHPFFYNPGFDIVENETITRNSVTIGHDVWMGRNVLILPRVSQIGNGAIIGAGAVVTKDVPAYAVVAGNPAKVIRYRFPEEIQQEVEASCWWEKTIDELKPDLKLFLNPFTNAFNGSKGG